ncbi:hypothetical protein OG462_14545 [Streptomyces sp. NBC_01077]|uniref:hypothetical protein n=1 Tax=Streptomyces sp. NBC_01077 TaxID=2903746 RepID=UPI00386F9533|nr:hypothetical protein OG462_14545 [Streptomyces sp. NBC_01077]
MSGHGRYRYVRALAAVATVLLAAGCQSGDRINCTLIGAESGVALTWKPGDFPAGAHYRLCVDQVCKDRQAQPSDDSLAMLRLPMPEVTGEKQVTVRLQVTDPAADRTVYDRSAPFTLRKHAPNGEACGPVVWSTGIRVDPERGLVSPG